MAGRFTIEAVFKAIDRVSAPVTRMQNRVGKMTRAMGKSIDRLNKNFTHLYGNIKSGAARATIAIGAMGLAMGNIISVGANFGRAIGRAASAFPEDIQRGTKEFRALEQAALDVGGTTEFTATETANALKFMAKAGFDAKFSIQSLADVVDFATTSEMDLATASDVASDALGAFNMNVGTTEQRMANFQRVMDVMSKTANSSNTSVMELFENIKDGGPVAIKAGQDIETFAAVSGVLANVGIKASRAGTATKNISLALAGVGNKAKETFERLNIPLSVDGRIRDVADVFDDLTKALEGKGEAEVVETMNAIFGKISLASAMSLLGQGADDIRSLRKELIEAGGYSKKTAGFIRNDVRGSLDSLNSAIEAVKINIKLMNEGPLKDAIDNMTNWIRLNQEPIAKMVGGAIAWVLNNIKEIVKWGKILGKVLITLAAFNMLLKTLVTVMLAVNLVMSLNPLGLIVIGIAAAIAAIAALIFWWDEVVATFKALPEPVQKAIQLMFWPITLLIKAAKTVMDNWEPIAGFFKTLWEGITENFTSAVDYMTSILDKLKQKFDLFIQIHVDAINSMRELFGMDLIGQDENAKQQPQQEPRIFGPDARASQILQESRITNSAEVTIRAEEGRAEVTKGQLSNNISLIQSGSL